MKKVIISMVVALVAAASVFAQKIPEWVLVDGSENQASARAQAYGEKKYGKGYQYIIGVSNKIASKSTAMSRAEEDLLARIGRQVGAKITANIDKTGFAEYFESEVEDGLIKIEEAFNISFSMKAPNVEFLEWFSEAGEQGGKKYYIGYVLGKFKTSEFCENVEKINVEKDINRWAKKIKSKTKKPIPADMLEEIVSDVEDGKEDYIEDLLEKESEENDDDDDDEE